MIGNKRSDTSLCTLAFFLCRAPSVPGAMTELCTVDYESWSDEDTA